MLKFKRTHIKNNSTKIYSDIVHQKKRRNINHRSYTFVTSYWNFSLKRNRKRRNIEFSNANKEKHAETVVPSIERCGVCVKCVNHGIRGKTLSRIDRWRLFRGQVVVEDRPRFAIHAHRYPSPRVILHSRLNVRLSVHVCPCRWNINELQGGPKCVGRPRYSEIRRGALDYVAYYTRFIYVRELWRKWGYRDPLLNNDSISFFVSTLWEDFEKASIYICERLWKLYSNDAILKFLIRLEFFFFFFSLFRILTTFN